MDKPFLSPLNYQVRIVDAQGRPTPEFQMKWRKLFQIASTIPDVSSAAAMSLLLDMLSNTEGVMLRRGVSAWAGLDSPGGTAKFLRADGTYGEPPQQTVDESEIDLSDVLTNNVSTARHGLTPKLPNDATQYLDGTGQWSTLAGGGSGGLGAWQPPTIGTDSSSAYATKGGVFVPLIDCALAYVWTCIAEVTDATYKASVWTVNGQELDAKLGETDAWTGDSTIGLNRITKLPTAAALTAGTPYALLATRTDAAATYALPVDGNGAAFTTVPCNNTGPFFRVASIDPQPHDTNDITTNLLMHGFAISG